MKRHCINPNCKSSNPKLARIVRNGFYFRRSDHRKITRYRCLNCNRYYSSASFDPNFRQKRRDLNAIIKRSLCSGISQRRLAFNLGINSKTIVRKFRILAGDAASSHQKWLKQFENDQIKHIQFDDLETSEHTKCKPLSVTLAVNEKTREILGFKISTMPAKGRLIHIAKRKYPYRMDERHKNWRSFFHELKPYIYENAALKSDENPFYVTPVKIAFPNAIHIRFPGARGSISGQGELKKLVFDPLFTLNHTCAMLRANLNRLFRRTWCTTKNIQGLKDHLNLFIAFYNQEYLPTCAIKGGS